MKSTKNMEADQADDDRLANIFPSDTLAVVECCLSRPLLSLGSVEVLLHAAIGFTGTNNLSEISTRSLISTSTVQAARVLCLKS